MSSRCDTISSGATRSGAGERARLQREHELSVARRFHAFLRERGLRLSVPLLGDPARREPDAICQGADGPVGIEVTCPYYDRAHAAATWARGLWARGLGLPSRAAPAPEGRPADRLPRPDPASALLDELLALLDRKLRKQYRLPTYLVLDASHAELTSSDEAAVLVPALAHTPPAGSPILAVYLALGRAHTTGTDFFEIAAP